MYGETTVPRTAPTLPVTAAMLGAKEISKVVAALCDTTRDPARLTTKSFALFAPSGAGKTAVAASVLVQLRMRLPWITTLHAPWTTAQWLSQLMPDAVCDHTGENVVLHLTRRRLLVIDGLGEEGDKRRERVQQITKTVLDHGRPMIITSRLPLDGPESLAKHYPHIRAALESRFVYLEAPR